ncbi:MAG: DUF3592 domain-containing protein [Sarcina sp.]
MTTNIKNDSTTSKIAIIILSILIITATIGSIFNFSIRLELLYTGEKTTATITSFQTISHTNRGTISYTYIPILNFDANGQEYLVNSSLNEISSKPNSIGAIIPIVFDRNNPNKVIINTINYTSSVLINELTTFLFIPTILGILYASLKFSKGKKLSLNVSWKRKTKACLALLIPLLYLFANLEKQLINMKLGQSPSIIFLIVFIVIIFIYLGLIINTIISFFNNSL